MLASFAPFLSVIQIILGIVIVILVVAQSKGSDLSGFMGGGDTTGSFRTKRGLEAVLYKVTIYFSIAFFLWTILTFVSLGSV